MGIKLYYKWMRINHPMAFQSEWLDVYDHLYVDINYALHYCSYGSKTENDIIGKLIWFLNIVIHKLFPTSSITIADDGPAPLAKLILQRKRRMIPSIESDNVEVSPLIFTPGTSFMSSIRSKLEKYMESVKKMYNVEIKYILGNEGEAELKLKHQIMENMARNSQDTHIIISNDADIISMFGTLDLNSLFKVFICSNIGVSLKKDTEIISIGHLINDHISKYGISYSCGLDFTLMSIMLGNDYLPKIYYLDYDKLFSSYKETIQEHIGLIQNNAELNIPVFTLLLKNIISKIKPCYVNKFIKSNYDSCLCENYIEGILWCLDMYMKGYCSKYNYMYENEEPPHPSALVCYLNRVEKCKMSDQIYPSIHPNLYTLLLLPKKALSLVHPKFREFADCCEFLYKQETCTVCHMMQGKLNELDKESQEYSKYQKELHSHEKTHAHIFVNDITEIIKEFNKKYEIM